MRYDSSCIKLQAVHTNSAQRARAMLKLTSRQQQVLELIRSAIEESGFPPTRAEIAAALGFRSANAAEEHLQALARKRAIELSPGTSRGIRLLDDDTHSSSPYQMSLRHPALQQLSLPLIGRVAAGAPLLAQQHVEAHYQLDATLFTATPDYLLKVRGMSMRDAGILDGDLLAVKKTDSARNGQIVVARLGDDVTVKRFRRNADSIDLLPENPEFQPIHVLPQQDDFALEGLVVGLVRSWR